MVTRRVMMPQAQDHPETIVALASAPGRSSRAIIRISGTSLGSVLGQVFLGDAHTDWTKRRVSECRFALGRSQHGEISCPVIVLNAPAPASYTGEDTVELILPGNPMLIERVIERLLSTGEARLAGPGEFSARAYLNDRLSLDQAEGIAACIAADSAEELICAQKLATGQTGSCYRDWADELLTILALVEAGIDFSDQEDVVAISPAKLCERLDTLRTAMELTLHQTSPTQAKAGVPVVALVGETNAGKSTLFNALLGFERSVQSEQHGSTRDCLIEPFDLASAIGRSCVVELADVPGFVREQHAKSPPVMRSTSLATAFVTKADVIVYCDPHGCFLPLALESDSAPELDSAADASFNSESVMAGVPMICVRTKADLLNVEVKSRTAQEKTKKTEKDSMTETIAVCALDHWQLDRLKELIAHAVLAQTGSSATSTILARHSRCISRAHKLIGALLDTIDPSQPALAGPEVCAEQLRVVLDELAEVLGRIDPDDVIGRVFATFCVGK